MTASGQRLQDLAYTLCVSTGTREIAQALHLAHDFLDQAIDSTAGVEKVTGTDRARTVIAVGQLNRPASYVPVLHS
ncbi:DUF5133 domain-containing protein [Streptomyces gramineus]|uniref:DUF5133 domain-containing protein n=1 Tax=Streptomyces gramineus TaxID=910542 RepID=UPI00398B4E73